MKSCISFEYLEVFNFVRLNLVAQMLWILSLMKNLYRYSRCLEVMGLINREQGGQWKHVKEGAPSILMCHPKCPRSFLHLYSLQAFVLLALPILSCTHIACECKQYGCTITFVSLFWYYVSPSFFPSFQI